MEPPSADWKCDDLPRSGCPRSTAQRQDHLLVTNACGVVQKGLLTFLGSLHKEVAKTTSGTLVYRFERQTARKKISFFQKH